MLRLFHMIWPHRIMYCYGEGKINNAIGFNECERNPNNLLDSNTLTILTRCPGVAVMSQVHSLRLGYLSGQLGLLRVPVGLWILCSHSAGHTHMHIHTHTQTRRHTHREEVKIIAAQEKVRGNGKRTGRRETREPKEREKSSMKHILMTSSV